MERTLKSLQEGISQGLEWAKENPGKATLAVAGVAAAVFGGYLIFSHIVYPQREELWTTAYLMVLGTAPVYFYIKGN